jgi:truncated hemoglobin YjbI
MIFSHASGSTATLEDSYFGPQVRTRHLTGSNTVEAFDTYLEAIEDLTDRGYVAA